MSCEPKKYFDIEDDDGFKHLADHGEWHTGKVDDCVKCNAGEIVKLEDPINETDQNPTQHDGPISRMFIYDAGKSQIFGPEKGGFRG